MKKVKAIVKKLVCLVVGHKTDPGIYTDSHGGLDALSYCKRCGAYDV